ncbi:MAG: thioredoxin domain-containing protein [Hyphomicrobiales bacterium]
MPTLMLFKDGQVAATQMGAQPKTRLVQWINDTIA